MSRAIVNVATGIHVAGQNRLIAHFPGEMAHLWTDRFPKGSPRHRSIPFSFKAHALREAAETTEVLLWLDACMIPGPRPLSDLWDKIERDGYYLCRNGWKNSDWTNVGALPDLFPGVTLGEAIETNKTIDHVVAGVIGLDLRHEIARQFLDQYYMLATTFAFCGPSHGPVGVRHRHDQTAASVIAWRLGMVLSNGPEWFSYDPPEGDTTDLSKTCIIARGIPI